MTDTNDHITKSKRGGFTPEQRAKAAATRAANRAKATAKAKPAEKPSEFAGLTKFNCADACGPEKCVVNGRTDAPYCAHPNKGKLQNIDMQNRDAMARLARAKDFIARQGE